MKRLLFILFLSFSISQDYHLNFDGNSYIKIEHIDSYEGINSFTWSSWYRVSEKDDWGYENMFLWNKDHWPNIDQSSIQAYLDFSNSDNSGPENNKIYFNADIDGSGPYEGWATHYGDDLKDWDWHLLTLVYESNENVDFYIDGQLISSTPSHGTNVVTNTQKIQIGCHAFSDRGFFIGDMYDFLFNNDALTQSEILNIYQMGFDGNSPNSGAYENPPPYDNVLGYWKYNNGMFFDYSDHQNHATIYGATWVENEVLGCADELACNYNSDANTDNDSCDYSCHDNGDYSLSFEGNWDNPNYVNIGRPINLFDGDDATIFIRFNSSEEGGYLINNDTVASNPQFKFMVRDDGNLYVAGESEIFNIQGPYNNSEWYDLFVIIEDGCVKVFIDDLEFESCGHGDMDTGDDYYIGAERASYDDQAGPFFKGFIDEVKMWNYALENFNNLEQSNSAFYKFNSGSGNILYDHSGNQNHGTIYGAEWNLYGDMNDDGELNILDVITVVNIAVGYTTFDDSADFTGDGQVNILDIIFIVQLVVNA